MLDAKNAETIESLVCNLIVTSGQLVDDGKAATVATLFEANATLAFIGYVPKAAEFNGIDAISAFYEAREANVDLKTRHVISNISVNKVSQKRVEARYLMVVYRGQQMQSSANEIFVADVNETLMYDDGRGWLITSRLIDAVFSIK